MDRANIKKSLLISSLVLISVCLAVAVTRLHRSDRSPDAPEITAESLLGHLKYLASDELTGRLSGTPGAEKAAEYIAREFKSYGVRPVGDNGGYFQSFSFISGVRLGKENKLTITSGKPGQAPLSGQSELPTDRRELSLGSEYMPTAFSQSGSFQGRAVFAGYGISAPELGYDDYQAADVKDKFVFVLRHGPEGENAHGKFGKYHALRYKALTAREKGARGIVYIDDSEDFSKSSLSRLRYDNTFADSGVAAFAISRGEARAIFNSAGLDLEALQDQTSREKEGAFSALGSVQLDFHCELHKETKETANVVGYLEGNDPHLKDEVIIIGAHYDHLGLGEVGSLAPKQGQEVHNGADDNASGTAGILELAEALSRHQDKLQRSFLFVAFSGEEEGLLGSRHYVEHPLFPLDMTIAMINMDMIGRPKGNRLIIGGSGTSPLWRDLLTGLNHETGFDLKFQDDGFGPSDHSSFYGKDIAVLFFFTGVHRDYHKPSDDYEKIDVNSEEKILEYIFRTAQALNTIDHRPLFTKAKESNKQEATGEFRVYLGTIPDYGEEVEGVKLSGVREGSPAEKAGLKSGDVIVECAGKKIKNIYDYTYTLQEHKVGEVVDIIVLRNSQRLSLKATLERRPQ